MARGHEVASFAHLETESILLDTQMTDLSEVPRIDITPCVPLSTSRVLHVRGEVFGVLVRLDDVPDYETGHDVSMAFGSLGSHPEVAYYAAHRCRHRVYGR